MANQLYGGSGLFGQPSFGDYSGLSGGVPVQMTPQQIQQQLAKQQDQYGGQPSYYDLYNSPESSGFLQNVNARQRLPTNPYVNAPPDLLRTAILQAEPMAQQQATTTEAINQMSVSNGLPPAPKGKMWEFDANSNQYVLVDDPLSNLSQDASQTAPVASAQQVAMPAPSSSSIVSGMFPEVDAMQRALYQQKQNEAMQAQAMQYARLDPMQQAQYGLYLGGQQLGGAIGGALGGVDPQLRLISMRNAISKQIDMRDPESYFKAATLANQAGDREFAASLVDAGTKIESTMSQVELRKAQAQKAKNYQQAQTDSAQKRATVSDLEQKLATDPTYKPTAQEIASVRWIIANESKSKTQIDQTTGQLYVIEGLNIQDAAPNIANYLKQTGTTVPTPAATTEAPTTTEAPATTATPTSAGTPIAKGVTAVPTAASKLKAEEEAATKAAKLEEDTRAAEALTAGIDNVRSVRALIKETRDLVKPSTTGLTGKILAIGSTEARELENKNRRIQANAVFEELAKLKSQSKTGATGFGALNLEELKTIQNKAANLDPMSPSYEKDLKDVDDYFAKIENTLSARSSRAQESLTAKPSNTPASQAKETRIKSLVDRAMADPRTKGTRAQVESTIRARPEFQ